MLLRSKSGIKKGVFKNFFTYFLAFLDPHFAQKRAFLGFRRDKTGILKNWFNVNPLFWA